MQIITRFYIGMSDSKMEKQIVHPEEILEFFKDRMDVEGFTAYEGKGGWNDKTENSLVVESVGLSESKAMELKERLENEFKQDSVMVARTGADVTF